MASAETWLANQSRGRAIAFIIALTLLIFAGLFEGAKEPTPIKSAVTSGTAIAAGQGEDLVLYQRIAERIATGETYYPVAAEEMRAGNYPLKPFVTFRLPNLAKLMAWLGAGPSRMLLITLCLLTLLVWWRRFGTMFDTPARQAIATLLMATGLGIGFQSTYLYLHDVWAGVLIALALGLHRPDRWWATLIVLLAAAHIRETAIAAMLLVASLALWSQRWREVAACGAALLVFAVTIWCHARQVSGVVQPDDIASPGWTSLGGWQFVVTAVHDTAGLRTLPRFLTAVVLPLSLLGWASRLPRHEALLICGLLGGYFALFMAAGRPDNFYWALWVSPFAILGLAFLPETIADLRKAWRRST